MWTALSFLLKPSTYNQQSESVQSCCYKVGVVDQLGQRAQLLLVDKDSSSIDFFASCLENDKTMVKVDSSYQKVEILKHLIDNQTDCVLINVDSSDTEIVPLLTQIKESCENRSVPLLVAGTNIPFETKLELLLYADDVFVLPIEPAELVLRIQKLVDNRIKVRSQILIDPLTGAYNDRFLIRELERHLNDFKRSHEPFTMIHMEIDDHHVTHPSEARDALLKGFVEYIQRSVRPMDVFCRYKDEGFILILPKTYKEDAIKLMNRLIGRFSQGEWKSTFSCVVLEFSEAIHSPENCLKMMAFPEDRRERQEKGLVIDRTEEQPSTHQKLLIAVIDDDRLIREMLKDQLADIGDEMVEVEIRSYSNGEEFFEDPWHRQNQRFLLIIDRVMPKMDGLELLQKIRTEYDRKRYVCLMLTSRDSESDIALAIQKGANDYVVKPFGLKELRARIRRLIRGTR
ncbi:response regulator [Brevibacillus choshinensis]|uniref:response regulator n=1 Tax=Brevibacillus choshinensis TaxID=54911 RepID=UPI001EED88A8|nr:response regulator [Brevibacillus choshinensis]